MFCSKNKRLFSDLLKTAIFPRCESLHLARVNVTADVYLPQ